MERAIKYFLGFAAMAALLLTAWMTTASVFQPEPDTRVGGHMRNNPPDTGLKFNFPDYSGSPTQTNHPLFLNKPSNVSQEVEYDPITNTYIIKNNIGSIRYRDPMTMTFEEYYQYELDQSLRNYWKERSDANDGGARKSGIPQLVIPGDAFETIFGSNVIDIRPQGSAELIFGVKANRRDDPALDVKQRSYANFDFDMKIQMNVMAKVGDKINFGVNYNTEAMFEFDNKMKLAYEGKEDEIIQLIEAGDVTLPLNGTLITGSQALFGIKTKLKFGNATITSIFSQQKSESQTISVSGGAQTNDFFIKADQYEENRHFFLSQYFYDNFNKSMSKLPVISSPVNINKIEVWVTTIGAATQENRNIVALQDLGERDSIYNKAIIYPNFATPPWPDNQSNSLLLSTLDRASLRNINTVSNYLAGAGLGMTAGIDFEKLENARKLNPSEYTLNGRLGFISINTRMNPDQVLAVAYQYTVIGDTAVYQVGEFSTDGINAPEALVVKLLKSTATNTQIPLWKLMMKNVYNIGAYQVNSEDFRLNVVYTNSENGIPMGFLNEGDIAGLPLIRALNLDNLNTQLDPVPDGVFDFIDGAATNGGTINSINGRIYFPVVEPFGKDLRKAIDQGNPESPLAYKYSYDELYTKTKYEAQQYPEKNRFALEGIYKSASSSEISLNAMNVPQGSVKVTAGGVVLQENIDYTVDYTLGRVRIINEGYLNSGTPISISLESNSLFNMQTKTLMGTHVDYRISNDLTLGATIMNLTERPLTQKVNFGDEPISNTIWGLDGTYQTESRFLTRMVDALPFISTKAPSRVTFTGEFAHLIPGHARAIGKTGTSYIDDFEGATSGIDIKNPSMWKVASTPQGQPALFPEEKSGTIAYGFNRARFNWYVIDPLFTRNNSLTPDHIKNDKDQQSNHFVREILETEVFPNKEPLNNQPTNIAVLNMAFYPSERGPYNFDALPSPYSSGLLPTGLLSDPDTRWGGVMRRIETSDFEQTNIDYIEFWMMDPFVYDPSHTGGYLYFNLGDVSEDVLKDGRKSYENGLPTSATVVNVDTTIWGRVPTMQALVNSFDNNPSSRQFQDVGLDGLSDADENSFYASYINDIQTIVTSPAALQEILNDPANDNFRYFRGGGLDSNQTPILDRYKRFNDVDGNSKTPEQTYENFPVMATTLPDIEDINLDNTLSTDERYFQYQVELKPSKMNVGENYITDIYETTVQLRNGTTSSIKWYQFKIPLQQPDRVVGNISDFKSIRFMRMFFRGFQQPVVCRFATMELVRSDWRKYRYGLLGPGDYVPGDENSLTTFDISAVNIEENGKRTPIPYVLPPEIEREINVGSTNLQKLNEQSLVMKVCNLNDGDARAAYKTADLDMRRYRKLQMYVHAEEVDPANSPLKNGEVTAFIRLGTDFTSNYYEYEVPLQLTPWYTSALDDDVIWPETNNFDIQLEKLTELKQERNVAMRSGNTDVTTTTPYIRMDGKNRITVVGVPNLSDVKVVMIGIRNPKKRTMGDGDDGLPKCTEVWFNELRLTDFDQEGGWAANSRLAADLADFGNVVLAGAISTPGFGSIEKKIAERQTEHITQFDIATNLELGKFFPEKAGIKIPMHVDYGEIISNPEYNPLNPDIKFKDDLATYANKAERDSIKKLSQDFTRRKSINFMNMRKNRTGTGTPRLYDISNFDFTYAYSELYQRNIDIEYHMKKQYRGAIGYNFAINPKNVKPFKKSKFLQKYKTLALIYDFNFYYLPRMISFRTDMEREYNESLLRNKTQSIIILEPTYVKTFNWNRIFNIRYDLSQALKLDFQATTNARVDEPPGRIDKSDGDYSAKRDTILMNIMGFGRTTSYNQTMNVDYNVPINKIPLLNWVNVSARYGSVFTWNAAPLAASYLGNTIENSNTKQLNVNANMVNLYNKIGYLKTINQKSQPAAVPGARGGRPAVPEPVEVEETEDTTRVTAGVIAKLIVDNTLRVMMGVRSASLSYQEGNGTLLPGFNPSPVLLGQDWNLGAPGAGFVFGSQKDIRQQAADNGWLTLSPEVNQAYMTKHTKNLSARSSIEPLPFLRIELTAQRNYSLNYQEYYRADSNGVFRSYSPSESGTFSISYLMYKTAFVNDDKSHLNANFENFKAYLLIIANRVASANPNWNGQYMTDSLTGIQFPDGYGPTSQDVMIPAFLAAYSGQNPENVGLDIFPKIPLPNWRLTYNGLTQIDFFKKYLTNFTINHSYRSTYNVGGFNTNIRSRLDQDGFQTMRDELGAQNFLPHYEIAQISLTEQFAPFIGFDATLKNSVLAKIEYKKSRNLSLSFSNIMLTDVISNEFVIGSGYRFKDVSFDIIAGRRTNIKSDLNLKADVSVRTNKTVLRKLVEEVDQISAGQRIVSINISADYFISNSVNVRLFFDRVINNPFVSNQYKNANTNAGFSIRFSLAQ